MTAQKRSTRKYRLKKRAEEMAETRRRIAAAAVELHGTVGPARTSLSAVARLAGVQRHTVYRHFPTEGELFEACSAHYFEQHAPPDLEPWRRLTEPRQRLRRVLTDLYGYYERTEPMFSNVLRDAEVLETLRPTLAPMQELLGEAAEIVASGWESANARRHLIAAAARHVVDFYTWRSLTAEGRLTRSEVIELAMGFVEAAAASERE